MTRPQPLARASAMLFFLAVTAATGQEQRASIEGTVKDGSGALVPGASVEARGASGSTVARSDGSGYFRFPSLSPGRYDIAANRSGVLRGRIRGVTVSLGQTLRVDIAVTATGFVEKVTVAGETPLIDVKQSASSSSIRESEVTKLPRGRDFTSLVVLAPGANWEGFSGFGGISVGGSTGSENRVVVDGVEITHLLRGGAGMGVVSDIVDEVQVKSSGSNAEHGGGTGGVLNVITRSGTDRWAGAAGAYYSGHWLRGPNRPSLQTSPDGTAAEYLTFAKDAFDRWEPGFVLSGPLKKGAAWFLASYHPSLQSTRRTVRFRANNQAGTYASSTTAHDVSANVAGKFQDRVRARFAVNTNPLVLDGVLPSENGIGNPEADYAVVTTVSNYTFSSHVEFAATPHLLVSARGGHWFANTHQAGIHQGPLYRFARSNVGMEGVPLALQGPQGTSNTFGNSETTRNVITRTTAQVDGTAYFSAAGRHAMKGGFHLDRPGNDVLSGATGNVVLLSWGDAFQGRRGPFGYYLVLSNGAVPERGTLTQGDVQASNLGLFIQDSWTISGRLTLNLGLRAERERVPSYTTAYGTSPTAIAFGLGDKLAPRLGAAWDIRGDGKWKVYGSWGIFYDAMKYALARDLFGGVKALGYWYTLDSPDWPNLMRTGCPPACPGTLIQGPIDFSRPKNEPDGNAIDPDLEPFRLQEAVVGIDHALSRVLSLGARYVHKHVDTVVEDMGALDSQGNQVYIIGNPGFHRAAQTGFGPAFPKAVRDYDALELTLDKRMASRWAVRASYLLSRLHGNYSGLSYGPEGAPFLNHGPAFDHPVVVFGADGRPVVGPLDSDRTHQLKAHAIYDSPFGTSLGTSIRVLSGTPVTREAYFIPGHRYSVKYRGRGSDGRLPTLSQVDLHLQHEIKLGGAKRLQASVTVQNLFDQDAPLLRYPWELRDVADVGEAEFFRGFDMQEIIAAQGLRGDPLFLKDYAFQPPREIRLGLKLMF